MKYFDENRKYQISLVGFLLVVSFLVFMKFVFGAGIWDVGKLDVVLLVVASYLCEKLSQKVMNVKLSWIGRGDRYLFRFVLSIGVWMLAIWVANPVENSTHDFFGYLLNISVVYMFSAAFFEVVNLLKIGGGK